MIRNAPESVTNLAQTAGRSLDHLIRTRQERLRGSQTERLGGLGPSCLAVQLSDATLRVNDGLGHALAIEGLHPPDQAMILQQDRSAQAHRE